MTTPATSVHRGFKSRSLWGGECQIVHESGTYAAATSIMSDDVIREHHIIVPRTARYYTRGSEHAPVDQLWFACHGYGQLAARFAEYLAALDADRRLVVAPEALSRYYLNTAAGGTHAQARVGATWMTREDRLNEIEDQGRYLDALHAQICGRLDGALPTLTVLGFSQGAATVARWVVRGTVAVHRLVLWGGRFPPDLDLDTHRARLAAMRVTVVIGSRDEYISADDIAAERERLERAGVPAQFVSFDGGHRLDRKVLRHLAELE
jgi:predicted esterase